MPTLNVRPLACAAYMAAALMQFTTGVNAADAPGTAPPAPSGSAARVNPPAAAASGLKVLYTRFGPLRLSVDAAGSNGFSHTVDVRKPTAAARVERAYLLASSSNTRAIGNGHVRLDGNPVTWSAAVFNNIPPTLPNFFHSVVADVTGIVRAKMDPRPAGITSFVLTEPVNNTFIDGEILAVVFRVPLASEHTIVLLFGAQQLAGDRFEVTLAESINRTVRGATADMGLGISYSAQPSNPAQYSIVEVNGTRLSTSAGGSDDGSLVNGALITAGGIGDSRANPPNPNLLPVNARTDDESYNLLPFIARTTRAVRIDTNNPSNDDNIFFAWFDLSARGDVNRDTDGDGLVDAWERFGYDHDGDGRIDVNLPRLGANYRKKDIFIAYAWMLAGPSEASSHQPSAAVLNAVRSSFANAPVSNPNGTQGINVHFRNLGGVPHDADLNPVWAQFDAIMNPRVSEAERRIYHRMLNGHAYDNTGSSGLSRGIPASDFIETLGRFPSNPGTFTERAGTIMHELGHNLGLRHGGVDHVNYKPNHLSVMSYFNQLVWLRRNNAPFLDYERFVLGDLNEANLSEPQGLNRIAGDGPIQIYGVRWFSPGPVSRIKNTNAHQNVDWNANGNATNVGVNVNLNNANGITVLRAGFSEWANIVYDGGDIGPGASSAKASMMTSPDDLKELTVEEYLRMQRNTIEMR